MSTIKSDAIINPIPEGLQKSLELNQKLINSVQPMIDAQERIKAVTHPLGEIALYSAGVDISSPAVESFKRISEPITSAISRLVPLEIGSSLYSAAGNIVKAFSVASDISTKMLNGCGSFLESTISSPVVQWLQNIDFTPMFTTLQDWAFNTQQYKDLNKIYLQAMYDAKWFPYAGWIADTSLFAEVEGILCSSRGMSQRCEKRIDKAILSYYTKAELKRIKKSWQQADLEPHIKKTLGQAIESCLRCEYALTISCLATMWEGLIFKKINVSSRQKMDKTKKQFADLNKENDYDSVFDDYFNNFIVSQCNGVEDVVEGIPNRHSISHSWYKKYPNRKAALNAILLTDFIIGLTPKEITEVTDE